MTETEILRIEQQRHEAAVYRAIDFLRDRGLVEDALFNELAKLDSDQLAEVLEEAGA